MSIKAANEKVYILLALIQVVKKNVFQFSHGTFNNAISLEQPRMCLMLENTDIWFFLSESPIWLHIRNLTNSYHSESLNANFVSVSTHSFANGIISARVTGLVGTEGCIASLNEV